MSENIIDELAKRLNAKTIHELRQLGRAIGVPHPADGKKNDLVDEIIAVASAKKDSEPPTKRGAPPKSQEYDRQLASDILRCREICLAKSLKTDDVKSFEIFVGSSSSAALDYIGKGILDFDGEECFLRTAGCREDFGSDIFVNRRFVDNYKLREGDCVEGRCKRTSYDEMAGLASVLKVNGMQPDASRPEYDKLTPIYANKQFKIARGGDDKTGRILDLIAPIGAGQRVIIVSPYGCGKTTMLKNIARGIMHNNRDAKLVFALIDVSPEEAAECTDSFDGADVFASTYASGTNSHIKTMRLALEYCKRQTELCNDVALIVDDLTRLARAYNADCKRAVSGLDCAAIDSVKKVLAAAKNTRDCGSLTVISALDTVCGDEIADNAYSALKDVCNHKITLSPSLARAKIYPSINFDETYSAYDDKLLGEREMQALVRLRDVEREKIFRLLEVTENNAQLIDRILG